MIQQNLYLYEFRGNFPHDRLESRWIRRNLVFYLPFRGVNKRGSHFRSGIPRSANGHPSQVEEVTGTGSVMVLRRTKEKVDILTVDTTGSLTWTTSDDAGEVASQSGVMGKSATVFPFILPGDLR